MFNKDKIDYYIRIHKELHGQNVSISDIFNDYARSYPNAFNYIEIIEKYIENSLVSEPSEKKMYGLFIGRCQPFSLGHNETIQQIIRDGFEPVIILGSTNKKDERNPLSFEERKYLIRLVYPDIKIIGIEDYDNWDEWFNSIIEHLDKEKITSNNAILYSHIKDSDRCDFFYKGFEFNSETYVRIFEINNFQIKNIDEKKCFLGNTIHATDIRKKENTAILNLDARIYKELKDSFGWWV